MKMPAILQLSIICVLIPGCSPDKSDSLQGYAEGEFVLLAAPASGVLQKLHVRRGQQVAAGTTVFELDRVGEEAGSHEAAGRLRNAEERLANLRTGRRPAEVEATAAQAEQAKASRELSQLQIGRAHV